MKVRKICLLQAMRIILLRAHLAIFGALLLYQINSQMKGGDEGWLCSVKTKTLFKA